ncbi:hypothetical protein GCM10009760_17800 [Kitasatospora kazusensis]|uniref:Uncharacterized protein n=1 Tax=Kitasatospora kazusensis TaxID=407974 RepID=A0ABN2Z609_9ACTN
MDVLKVAHHGSANQDWDSTGALSPRLALISCGADNSYGHPAPNTVDRLRALGATVLRTDRSGDIAVLGTRSHLHAAVHPHQHPPERPPHRPSPARSPPARAGPAQRQSGSDSGRPASPIQWLAEVGVGDPDRTGWEQAAPTQVSLITVEGHGEASVQPVPRWPGVRPRRTLRP